MAVDPEDSVRPDGRTIRRMRRARGWSRRAFVRAIGDASVREAGIRETISPNLLEGIEEANERIPYATLCRIAGALERDPVELVME